MNCVKCGRNLNENDSFCPNCGTPVQRQDENNKIENNIEGNNNYSQNSSALNNENIKNEINDSTQTHNSNQSINNNMYSYQRPNNYQNNYQNDYQNNYQKYGQNNYQKYSQNNSPRLGTGINLAKIIIIILAIIIGIPLIILIVSLGVYIYSTATDEIKNVDNTVSTIIETDNTITSNVISNEPSNTVTPVVTPTGIDRSSTYKVKYKGFNLYIPDDLIYLYNSDSSLMVEDTLGTWMINFVIEQVPYQQVKQNRNSLTSYYAEQGITLSMPKIETIGGTEYILYEATAYGENFLLGCAEMNSMYTMTFEVFTEDNDYNKDLLKNLSYIVSSSEYIGESSYLKSNENIKMSDIVEAFKKMSEEQ